MNPYPTSPVTDQPSQIESKNIIKVTVPLSVLLKLLRESDDMNVSMPTDRPQAYWTLRDTLELTWTVDDSNPMPF